MESLEQWKYKEVLAPCLSGAVKSGAAGFASVLFTMDHVWRAGKEQGLSHSFWFQTNGDRIVQTNGNEISGWW